MPNGGGESFVFDDLPEYKKKIIRRYHRRQEEERRMREDPAYRPPHPNAKLSFQQVTDIRERWAGKLEEGPLYGKNRMDFVRLLAREYAVSTSSILHYVTGRTRLVDTDAPSLKEITEAEGE